MNRQEIAKNTLPQFLDIINSDLLRLVHDLKQSVGVAIVAEDKTQATRLAEFYSELSELQQSFDRITTLTNNKKGTDHE